MEKKLISPDTQIGLKFAYSLHIYRSRSLLQPGMCEMVDVVGGVGRSAHPHFGARS